jgi:hypothetical protein
VLWLAVREARQAPEVPEVGAARIGTVIGGKDLGDSGRSRCVERKIVTDPSLEVPGAGLDDGDCAVTVDCRGSLV